MSPLEISIAIHYWCFPKPYKGGSEHWTDLESKIVQEMIDRHLIEPNTQAGSLSEGRALTGNTPAMRCFIEGLEAVPWPTLIWVLPDSSAPTVGVEHD